MALEAVVDHSELLDDVRGLGPDVTAKLFVSIFNKSKLTYKLASVFKEGGDDMICAALERLDLSAGVTYYNSAGKGCRGP